jgi:hypothetical protein
LKKGYVNIVQDRLFWIQKQTFLLKWNHPHFFFLLFNFNPKVFFFFLIFFFFFFFFLFLFPFLFIFHFYFVSLIIFNLVCIYSEIEFIKPLEDVKIQGTTITFTKDEEDCTVFINKMINSGIMRMFIFFFLYHFYICIFYFVSQVLCICTDDYNYFSMRNFFFFIVMILFFIYLIIWWGIGIASESKLEVLKDCWFSSHNCFYYFLFFCLIILFYYYSNIPYIRE